MMENSTEEDAPGNPLTVQSTPSILKQEEADPPNRPIISRPGLGTAGRRISLLANHFIVSVKNPTEIFYQYSVSISYEDKKAVENKAIARKVIDKLYQTYSSEFSGKKFAFDGGKCLYTVGPLPQNKFELAVVLEESFARRSPVDAVKRSRRSLQPKSFTVEISYAAKIPLKSLALALQGADVENTQDSLRVLDTILRQHAANRGCLLVRQSFFTDDSRNNTDIGGGVTGCRGFHTSFRPTNGGLSLNIDVSTTMILTPGPVIDFLKANQNARDPRSIDWLKAKKMLKNMRIKTNHHNGEFKITGLSEKPCKDQMFQLKVKNGETACDGETVVDITVYEYFTKHREIPLSSSVFMPCLDIGKPKRPIYLPLELCSLVSLQRYTKALSSAQRASLVEKSRQKPPERIQVISDALKSYNYENDPLLSACGISIEKQLTQVEGRVLETPILKVGRKEDCIPRDGRWNFKNKHLMKPTKIERWALINFSAKFDASYLSRELINCGRNKGIHIERPYTIIEEDVQNRKAGPIVRVEKMCERIMAKLPSPPQLFLCVLPEKKNCDIYGPWKKMCLTEIGSATQCMCPTKITDQYLTNVLLKINTKLGGTNSLLANELKAIIPLVQDSPTMILGMDVSHGSPGRSDFPSIAAVVGSRSWPLISRYRASVRTQSSKVEMIESLYKPKPDGEDDGIMRELLMDFYKTSNGRKPSQIIVFRDGVSESQFNQVLNIELNQMIKAYQHLGEVNVPKFTVIVAQKNHHTKLFQANAPENVPPGTVVDTKIVHPKNYDFYMCAQAGMIGTSRPTHYQVLYDEIGFSPDALQTLIHSLCYVYQRSTAAVSIVAPICYAHLAAAQMSHFIKLEDSSETSSTDGTVPIPELPRLHEDVEGSMFFC